MSDVFTKAKRSEVMSRIRSRGNRDTELAMARLFRLHRITGWRRHKRVRAPGRGPSRRLSSKVKNSREPGALPLTAYPDFVFSRKRVVVFVDGCFWHGCPKHATSPRNNAEFWRRKLAGNRARDRRVTRALRKDGWRVVRIWEHDVVKRGGHWAARLIQLLAGP